jgi:hypothetical protein
MTKNNPVLHKNDLQIGKQPSKKQLSCDGIISTEATTGNAPNKLEATNYIVEDAYAISGENSSKQGAIKKIMYSQVKPILHQLL